MTSILTEGAVNAPAVVALATYILSTWGIFDSKLQPESYSVILAFNILHLKQDVDKVLDRIKELLAPGGLLISKTVCAGEKFSLVPILMRPFSKLVRISAHRDHSFRLIVTAHFG
jgi:2-polyprenyl-3-methyl-5-hydroxy-6-metoxy-1,4-benzoquinol methylase